jgi:hypothetical protein
VPLGRRVREEDAPLLTFLRGAREAKVPIKPSYLQILNTLVIITENFFTIFTMKILWIFFGNSMEIH